MKWYESTSAAWIRLMARPRRSSFRSGIVLARQVKSTLVGNHMSLARSGWRNRCCQAEFLARFGDHTDALWSFTWARFGVGKTDARSNAQKKGEDAV
jgi:hypothetical protein